MDVSTIFDVIGKIVLVTGGGRGIGRMIAEAYVANGATVYISSRDVAACDTAVAELNALKKGKAYSVPANFVKLEECQRLKDVIEKQEGKLDVLVNNSGNVWAEHYDTFPDAAWTRVLTLNVHRVFTLTQLFTPMLEKAASEGSPSRVINIGSVEGEVASSLQVYSYTAAKAGLHHLSRTLSNVLGQRNITCNTIACGPFRSKMMAESLEKGEKDIIKHIPLHRIGKPQDIGGTCIFLSSQAGAYVNGATITLDGGSIYYHELPGKGEFPTQFSKI